MQKWFNSTLAQETRPLQTPFSDEDWAQTPLAVQEFLLSLIVHVQKLEAEIAKLSEQVKRNAHNSSKPPSSDGPEVPPNQASEPKASASVGQPGHKGTTRKLVPIEQVKESHDIKPEVCRQCGHGLEGEDPEPYHH